MLINNMYKKLIFLTLLCLTNNMFAMETLQLLLLYNSVLNALAQANADGTKEEEYTKTIRETLLPRNKINNKDMRNNTLLHMAVDNNNHILISLLLKMEAFQHIKNDLGFTPFGRAIKQQRGQCALLLLEHGANSQDRFYPGTQRDLLFAYHYKRSKCAESKKYFKFMAPLHSELLGKKLTPYEEKPSAQGKQPFEFLDRLILDRKSTIESYNKYKVIPDNPIILYNKLTNCDSLSHAHQ